MPDIFVTRVVRRLLVMRSTTHQDIITSYIQLRSKREYSGISDNRAHFFAVPAVTITDLVPRTNPSLLEDPEDNILDEGGK